MIHGIIPIHTATASQDISGTLTGYSGTAMRTLKKLINTQEFGKGRAVIFAVHPAKYENRD